MKGAVKTNIPTVDRPPGDKGIVEAASPPFAETIRLFPDRANVQFVRHNVVGVRKLKSALAAYCADHSSI